MRIALLLAILPACSREAPHIPPGNDTGTAVLSTEPPVTETFDVGPAELDMLWVVDDSCAMFEEQDILALHADLLMEQMAPYNFRIGVVTTSLTGFRTVGGARWIDPATPTPTDAFAQMVRVGEHGSFDERGFDAGYAALIDASFPRPTALLSVVMLSDEDDHSHQITGTEFAQFVEGDRGDAERASISVIVGLDAICGAEQGDKYIAVAESTGGVVLSICDTDWSAAISGATELYHWSAELLYPPIPSTIEVSVDDKGVVFVIEAADWVHDPVANTITLKSFVPALDSVVWVVYEKAE